jgi:CSLREA domain-containing protein
MRTLPSTRLTSVGARLGSARHCPQNTRSSRASAGKQLLIAAALSVAAASALTNMGQVRIFSASSFVVNDTSDRLDASPGDGLCRTSIATCSLRAAIQEANATTDPDVIQLPAGIYTIARAPFNENDITVGDLDITAPLTITGAGSSATFIDGGRAPFGAPPEQAALDRLFEIHPAAGRVTISSLTIPSGW